MKAKAKKAADTPAAIKSFLDKVLSTPEDQLADVLEAFTWKADKGDFHHWVPLFNFFDAYFEKHVQSRPDLQLKSESAKPEEELASRTLIAVLKVTGSILENCSNKHLYSSCEHLTTLLAASDQGVVTATLQAFVALVRKTHIASIRYPGGPEQNARLLALAQGWGGKEQGLGLLECAHEDESAVNEGLSLATRLHFDFYSEAQQDNREVSGLKTIDIQRLDKHQANDYGLLSQLVSEYQVPEPLRFTLLTKIRTAKGFGSLQGRRYLVRTRLLAFYVWFQSQPGHDETAAFFQKEGEIVSELVALLQAESAVPEDLRTLALRALAVQLLDRTRHTPVISAISSGGQTSLLSMLMHKAVGSVTGSQAAVINQGQYSMQFVEALLSLLGALVACSSGCAALSDAGVVPALLPLVRDTDPDHVNLVSAGVRILEAFMDFNAAAATVFRDLGGLQAMIQRLETEVGHNTEQMSTDEAMSMPTAATSDQPSTSAAAPQVATDTKLVPYARRVLLKSLLRAVALASYHHGNGMRGTEDDQSKLFACLKVVIERGQEFGGALFALAASVMSDLIHHDPLCFGTLEKAGLPETYLKAIQAGVLPSGEAVCSLPNTLVALCLNNAGMERVRQTKALGCFVSIFTSKAYIKALQGDTPPALGAGLDELLRHVSSLRKEGVEMIVDILKRLCEMGGLPVPVSDDPMDTDAPAANEPPAATEASVPVPPESNQDVEMTGEEQAATSTAQAAQQPPTKKAPVDPDAASYLPECITHTARLLESMFSNHDTCSKFVQQGGVEVLLQLYKLPKLPPTFGSSSASHSLLAMFRSLTAHNSSDISSKLQPSLSSQFTITLQLAEAIDDRMVPELPAAERDLYIRHVSGTVGLAALAATVVRVAPALLLSLCSTEEGKAEPILSQLGKLERRVLWQLAQAENWKRDQDAAKEAAKGGPAPEAESSFGAPSADAAELSTGRDVFMAATAPADVELLDDADTETAAAADREAAASATSRGRKKTPEELSVEVLLHFVGTVRAFYASVAKAVHAQARRRDDPAFQPNPSMKAASVTLGVILKHNLTATHKVAEDDKGKSKGPMFHQGQPEAMRYLQRVVDEVLAVIFDSRRQSCHGLVLNNFVSCSGFKQLLVQFQVACQVLFDAVDRQEAQPEADPAAGKAHGTADSDLVITKPDPADSPKQAAEKLVWSFLVLFENLVSARTLLKSLQEATLLVTPAPGQPALAKGTEISTVEAFVKKLQATITKAVLPLWSYHKLPKCSFRITRQVISILTDCTTGTAAATTALNRIATVSRPVAAPDPAMVQTIVDMGFSRARVEDTLRRFGNSSAELAIEWLMTHPEEQGTADAAAADTASKDEDEAVKKQLIASLGTDEVPKLEALLDESAEAPSIQQLVDGSVVTVAQMPAAAFPLADMLVSLCGQEAGENKQQVFASLVQHIKRLAAAQEAGVQDRPEVLLAPVHLLAILLTEDKARGSPTAFVCSADQEGLFDVALNMLDAWTQQHAVSQAPAEGAAAITEVPRWIDALLLCLDMGMQPQPAPQTQPEQTPGTSAVGPSTATPPAAAQAPPTDAATSSSTPAATAPSTQAPTASEHAAASAAGQEGAEPPSTAEGNKQEPPVTKSLEERQQAATQMLRDNIRTMFLPNGLVSQQQLERAASICTKLLQHLHAWGSVWSVPDSEPAESEAFSRPQPASSTQAVVQVLARVTKSHKVALKVLAARGPRLILEMPGACFLPEHEPYVSAIFRHILEDPVTLQAAMEAEIRNTLSARGLHADAAGGSSAAMPVRQFLSTISPVIAREPAVFVEAMANTCNVEEASGAMGSGRPIVLLKPKSDDKASSHKDKPSGTASAPEGPSIPASANPSAPPSAAGTATPRTTGLTRQGSGRAGGTPKAKDTPKTASKGAAKGSKKTVPASFVEVIDCLVDVTLRYKGMQPGEEADLADPVSEAMETDEPFTISAQLPDGRVVRVSATQPGRGAGAAAGQQPGASQTAGQGGQSKAPAKASFTEQAMNPKRREVLVQCLALKMLTDFTLMYSSCVGVLLKRDGEIAAKESGMKTPGKGTQTGAGALFKHVMHAHLTHLSEPSTTLQGLTEQAAFFLLSICIRSAEGRRRIVSEIAHTLNPSDRSEQRPEHQSGVRRAASNPYRAQPGFPAPHKVKAFVELVSSLLSASISNPSSQDGASPPGLAGEMLRVMKEAGVLKGLTNALKLVDTDHPQAGKSITGILKPLEILTRPQLPRSKPSTGATAAAAAAATAHQAAAASTQGAGSAAGANEAAAGRAGSQPVQHSTAPAEGARGADASMEDAEESAAGPEAMAAAEAAREAGMRARNQGRRNFNPRTMEALVEDMIEQAYAGDGLEGFNSDSEDDHSDDEGDHLEGMSGDEQMGEQEDFEGSDGFDEDDEHDSEGDDEDDDDEDDEDDDDEDDDMSEEDSEPFSDSEGSEGEDEDAEAVDVVLDHDDDDMNPDANGAVVINMDGHHPEDGMGEADNDEGDEDDEEDEDDDEEDEDEEEDEAYDEDGSDMGAYMPGEDEDADWDLDLLNEEDDGVVHWDAVGDLLGNMGGAGMRNMNADRRRHRIMQSRGTRALGEGPQAAAAIASGPAAPSAQHRLLQRPSSLSGAAAQAGLAAGRADAAGALMEGMPAGLRRIAGQAAQLLTSHPGLAFPDNIRSLFGAIPGGAMARGGAIGPLPGGFQTAAEMGQTHAQAGTRAGGWAEGVGSNATAVSSLAGALERQLLDVLQQPRAAAAAGAAAGEAPQQQADPAAQGADHNQAQPDTAEAQRNEQLQARHQELQGQLEELTSIQNRAVQALQAAAAGSGQRAQQPAAPPTAQPNSSQQAAPSTADQGGPAAPAAPATGASTSTAAVGPSQSTPQPVPFRTLAAPAAPNATSARGLAQVLEPSPAGSDARAGRITSAMFGSAMQAAMQAAQQGPGAASSSQSPQHPTPASGPPPPVHSGDQDMAEADDADEPAPPADIQIGPISSTPAGDADTAMDEEPAAPIDVPMGSLDTAAAMDTEARPGSALGAQLVQAAQDAGIDLAFLEALPEELRAEVLAAHGVTLPPPGPPAAAPAAAAAPEAAAAPAEQPVEGAAAAATPSEGEAAAQAAEASAGPSAEAAAVAAAPAVEDEGDSIDPEFLAALPPEIQAEVLEQQRRERRMRERQRQQQQAAAAAAQGGGAGAGAAAGAGSEMDLATILATFPPDVREEVLLTSEEDVINSLPPALLAEAQQLRQRVMQHYRDNHASAGGRGVVFVGGPNSTTYARRGGTAGGRGAGAPGSGPGSSAYNLMRLQSEGAAALGSTDRAVEGPPQVEEEAVLLLTGLLKLAEAPARAQLQRVLLNLCAHPESRKQVMQILMSMLRAPLSADEAAEASQRDTQMDESEASTSQCLVPSPVRPGQEVLPHVSRRVLEYANHLARNRSEVARDMLRLRVPTPDQLARHTAALQDKKGKGRPMDWATEVSHEERALEVLIGMTAKTLCRRSNSHLEQALLLVEVSLGHANLHWGMLIEQHSARKAAAAEAKRAAEAAKEAEAKQAAEPASKAETERQQQASGAAEAGSSGDGAAAMQPALGTSQSPGSAEQRPGASSAATPSHTTAGAGATTAAGMPPAQDATSSAPAASSSAQHAAAEAVIPDLNQQDNPGPVIQSLPEHLLKQLARLLGQSGLSELAQKRCASVIRMLVDTCPQLKPLMLSELQNELQRLSKLAGEELSALQARNFSSAGDISAHASAVRVLLLRVLKAAVSLTKAKGGKQDQAKEQVDEQDAAITAEMSQRLDPLWAALSATITQIEANLPAHTDTSSEAPSAAASILPPGAAQVLPLVEAFFVMCDARTLPQTQPSSPLLSSMSAEFPLGATPGPSTMEPPSQQTPSSRQHAHGGASAPSQPVAEPHVPFLRFAEKHRRLLNTLLRQNASLLQGSLQPLLKVPRLIEFDNKRSYFRARIHSSGDDHRRYGGLRLAVRRSHVFEDSFHQMRMRSPDEMRMKLSVQFQGEEGIDAGGVSREWYQVMAREIFNPNFSLFVQVPEHGTTFQPNANSVVQNDEARGTNHLDFFKFVGRILGKALYDGQLIDAFFTRSFYKHMLGDPLTYEDIEAVDPEYYKNLRWMLENNITDVLDLTFTEESDYFGKKELVELKPGGKDIRVTEENKREYVNLVARHRMTTAIKPQINSFLEGFWDLVPKVSFCSFHLIPHSGASCGLITHSGLKAQVYVVCDKNRVSTRRATGHALCALHPVPCL
ncbi:TPA: hypothetical protein ACH3X1_000730 [Trebouxia sp. C0004]